MNPWTACKIPTIFTSWTNAAEYGGDWRQNTNKEIQSLIRLYTNGHFSTLTLVISIKNVGGMHSSHFSDGRQPPAAPARSGLLLPPPQPPPRGLFPPPTQAGGQDATEISPIIGLLKEPVVSLPPPGWNVNQWWTQYFPVPSSLQQHAQMTTNKPANNKFQFLIWQKMAATGHVGGGEGERHKLARWQAPLLTSPSKAVFFNSRHFGVFSSLPTSWSHHETKAGSWKNQSASKTFLFSA